MEMGVPFELAPADVAEISDAVYAPNVSFLNAIAKAEKIASERPLELVLGADTVIELGGHILGKPNDDAHAAEMLALLSGREHFVVTAVCLRRLSDSVFCLFGEATRVRFKRLSRELIAEYLRKVHTLDKAGAYAIQEHGDMIVERIDGPLDNVIGLPCDKLGKALRALRFIS